MSKVTCTVFFSVNALFRLPDAGKFLGYGLGQCEQVSHFLQHLCFLCFIWVTFRRPFHFRHPFEYAPISLIITQTSGRRHCEVCFCAKSVLADGGLCIQLSSAQLGVLRHNKHSYSLEVSQTSSSETQGLDAATAEQHSYTYIIQQQLQRMQQWLQLCMCKCI